MIEKLIQKLKGDPNYHFKNSYTLFDLVIIVSDRGIQLVRGLLFTKFRLKKCDGLVFIGRAVRIRHFRKISVGRNFILGNYSTLNGLSSNGIEIGDNVSIGDNCTIICTGIISEIGTGIKIGRGTGINAFSFLAGQGGIVIGENVIIGPGVKIFSENHVFSNIIEPIKNQGVTRQGVEIEDNCWIGANVTILDGVCIKTGTVVAAGSVVNKSFPAMSIIGGVPAKIIRSRNN